MRLHTQRAEFPPPCESAASQYRVGLLRFASGRVLVVQGGVFECSSRMNGKPSSPVLRGLGASDGARLLDSNGAVEFIGITSGLPVIRPQSRIYLAESPVNTTRLLEGNSAGPVRDLHGHEACKRYLTRVESPRGERPMDNMPAELLNDYPLGRTSVANCFGPWERQR